MEVPNLYPLPNSITATKGRFFFQISFYLQSVLVHSANCVKCYTMARRRVLISTPL
jgi:hypothetical protein